MLESVPAQDVLIAAGAREIETEKPTQCVSGTVLAFDFGERRIGVAVGELALGIAHPVETIDAVANQPRFSRIAALIDEWQPVLLVVGLPRRMDGTEHQMTELARKFARRLHGRFGIEIALEDERLTSAEAEQDATGQRIERRPKSKCMSINWQPKRYSIPFLASRRVSS